MSNDLALAVEIQVEGQKAVEQINKVNDAVKGMGEQFQTAGGEGSSAGDSIFAGMFKAQLAMEGLRMAIRAVTEAFKGILETGIMFNAAMSGSALGIGTLISAMSTLKDANGNVLTGQNALNAGMALGAEQVDKLRIGSFQTVATVRQLTDAYQQGLGPMLAGGVALKDTTGLTVKFAQAAGALGLDMGTLGHEMRATFSGTISARITKIASALQISSSDIAQWKQAGTLVEELNKKFEFFGMAGKMVEESWKGVTSNLEHAFEAGAGEMVKPLFEALRTGLHDAMGEAFDMSSGGFSEKFKPILDAGSEVFGELGKLAKDSLKWAVGAAEDLAKWFRANKAEVTEMVTAAGLLAGQMGGIVKLIGSMVGGIGEGVGGITVFSAMVNGISMVFAMVNDTVHLIGGAVGSIGMVLLNGVLGPIQAVLMIIGSILNDPNGMGAILKKGSGDGLIDKAAALQGYLDRGYEGVNKMVVPILTGDGAVMKLSQSIADATTKAEGMAAAVKKAVTPLANATSNGPKDKPESESEGLRALEQANSLLANNIKAHATLTLDDQEEVALMKAKLEIDKERATIMKANEAHDSPDGKKVKGISDTDAKARMESATTTLDALEIKIHTEFTEKRRLMAEALQVALTAGEEGGMAKRMAALQVGFEKERKQNAELGNLHSEAEMKASQDAAIERARQEEVTAQVAKLKKALAEMAQINGGPLTSGELAAAIDTFAGKSREAATAAQKVREELHLGQGAAAGFEAGLRESLIRGGNSFTLLKTFATNAISGITSSFATMFASILTSGNSFSDKMKALWKGVSQAVVQALAQMAAQYLVNRAIEAAMSTAWGNEAAAKLGIQTKDSIASGTNATTVVDAEVAKAKALAATGAAAKLSGGAQTIALSAVETAAPIAATAVSGAAMDMVLDYGVITKAALVAGAAEAWEAYGGIPIYGAIAAAAQITAMNLSVEAEAALPAFANGGLVSKATIGLMAERAPEVIAPESSFHDYSKTMFAMGANLAGNLGANNRQAQNYRGASAGYGAQAASGGAGAAGGRGGAYVDLRGAVIAGESAESSRQIGNLVKKHLDLYNRRAG